MNGIMTTATAVYTETLVLKSFTGGRGEGMGSWGDEEAM